MVPEMGFRVLGRSASEAMSWVHDTAVLVVCLIA